MSFVTLLHQGDGLGQASAFAFEHAMAHRNYLGQMATLPQFSVIPYLIDPVVADPNQSGSKWHLNHQQSHDDALKNIPNTWDFYATYPLEPTSIGLFIGQDLRDTSFANQGQKSWWTFANHMEHYVANSATLPASTEPPLMVFPFW